MSYGPVTPEQLALLFCEYYPEFRRKRQLEKKREHGTPGRPPTQISPQAGRVLETFIEFLYEIAQVKSSDGKMVIIVDSSKYDPSEGLNLPCTQKSKSEKHDSSQEVMEKLAQADLIGEDNDSFSENITSEEEEEEEESYTEEEEEEEEEEEDEEEYNKIYEEDNPRSTKKNLRSTSRAGPVMDEVSFSVPITDENIPIDPSKAISITDELAKEKGPIHIQKHRELGSIDDLVAKQNVEKQNKGNKTKKLHFNLRDDDDE
jgi:hypothetical protein